MESRTMQLALDLRLFVYIGLNMCLKVIYVYWAEHVPEGDLCTVG